MGLMMARTKLESLVHTNSELSQHVGVFVVVSKHHGLSPEGSPRRENGTLIPWAKPWRVPSREGNPTIEVESAGLAIEAQPPAASIMPAIT